MRTATTAATITIAATAIAATTTAIATTAIVIVLTADSRGLTAAEIAGNSLRAVVGSIVDGVIAVVIAI